MKDEGGFSELGPLPASDDNARLQRESIKALNRLLTGFDRLIFRDERIEDYGVDGSFELNLAGYMTNLRGQAQLKASAQVTTTKAGYIPLQVDTANLNYLLNGCSPIYLLWDAQTDEFWYVWAQDESRRLFQENPSWFQQEKVTLQFRNRLTPDVLPSVVDRILRYGRQERQVRDRLARATEGENVFFRIDADSLDVTDGSKATSMLLASGTAIVAAGFPRRALDLLRLVDPPIAALPRMELVAGYAEYMIGNHWTALGHIRQAQARVGELSTRDAAFLESLKDASELHAGLIDSETYEEHANRRAVRLTGLGRLEAEQDAVYRRCARSTNLQNRSDDAKRLRQITEQILRHPQALPAHKLSSTLLLLYIEGIEANLAATRTVFAAEIRGQLFSGDVEGVGRTLRRAREYHSEWEAQVVKALNEAYDLNHPILIFQALTIALRIRIGRLFEQKLDAIMHEMPYEVPPASRTQVESMMQEASQMNSLIGSLEGKLELQEIEADFLEIEGRRDAARQLAKQTHTVASAMAFKSIAEHAKRLLDNDTVTSRWEQHYEQLRSEDPDVQNANQNDEELNRVADQILLSVESPPARLEVIVELLRSFRAVSRERLDWCRHLNIFEDLTKTTDPQTAFTELPTRKCHCAKFSYESHNAQTDASVVISEFKRTFCSSCEGREPKRG